MGKVIDSSVLIAAERGQLDLSAALSDHRDENFSISAVTASELLHGVHRVASSKRAATEVFVEGILERLPVLAFDLRSARMHARLWVETVSSGTSIGERDLIIAATALAHEHSVVTRDRRSFPRIPGLTVIHW
ncbi:MAG: PIN domain-containing protein [Candidatus Binatia bacterium]